MLPIYSKQYLLLQHNSSHACLVPVLASRTNAGVYIAYACERQQRGDGV